MWPAGPVSVPHPLTLLERFFPVSPFLCRPFRTGPDCPVTLTRRAEGGLSPERYETYFYAIKIRSPILPTQLPVSVSLKLKPFKENCHRRVEPPSWQLAGAACRRNPSSAPMGQAGAGKREELEHPTHLSLPDWGSVSSVSLLPLPTTSCRFPSSLRAARVCIGDEQDPAYRTLRLFLLFCPILVNPGNSPCSLFLACSFLLALDVSNALRRTHRLFQLCEDEKAKNAERQEVLLRS